MGNQEVIIRIIALIVVIIFFPVAIFLLFRWKDKSQNKLEEMKKSERKKLNGKKKNG